MKRTAPSSITVSWISWIMTSICAALFSASSFVIYGTSIVTAMPRTPNGQTLVETVYAAVLTGLLSWFTLTNARRLRRGNPDARKVLAVLAGGLILSSVTSGPGLAPAGVIIFFAVSGGVAMFLPSSSHFLRDRPTGV